MQLTTEECNRIINSALLQQELFTKDQLVLYNVARECLYVRGKPTAESVARVCALSKSFIRDVPGDENGKHRIKSLANIDTLSKLNPDEMMTEDYFLSLYSKMSLGELNCRGL